MKRQATGSISISTDAIAEAVAEHLQPIIERLSATPAPLSTDEIRHALADVIGSLAAFRGMPESDYQLAVQITMALQAAGYTLISTTTPASEVETEPAQTWFSRESD